MEIIQDKIEVDGFEFYTISVMLPKTSLLIVGNDVGFIMCGALDVEIYNSAKLLPRGVVCAKVVGVRSIEDILNAKIHEASKKAIEMGIDKGLEVKDALRLLS